MLTECEYKAVLMSDIFASIRVFLVGSGVLSAPPQADDSVHLYGWSSNRGHHLRQPFRQVSFFFY